MMALDHSMCFSRRIPQAFIAAGDGVILMRLAAGGREMASAMKFTASCSKAFPDVAVGAVVDVDCWLLPA